MAVFILGKLCGPQFFYLCMTYYLSTVDELIVGGGLIQLVIDALNDFAVPIRKLWLCLYQFRETVARR